MHPRDALREWNGLGQAIGLRLVLFEGGSSFHDQRASRPHLPKGDIHVQYSQIICRRASQGRAAAERYQTEAQPRQQVTPRRPDSVSLTRSVTSVTIGDEEILNVDLKRRRQFSERGNRPSLPARLNVDNLNPVDARLTRKVTLRKLSMVSPNCQGRLVTE